MKQTRLSLSTRLAFLPAAALILAAVCPCRAQDNGGSGLLGSSPPVINFDLPDDGPVTNEDADASKIYPLAAYLPGTGFVAAGYLSHRGILSSTDKLEVYGATTLGPQKAWVLNYSDSAFLRSAFKLKAWASYANFERKYYGHGNQTSAEERAGFLPGTMEYGLAFSRRLGSKLNVEAAFVSREWDLHLDSETEGDLPLGERNGGLNRLLRVDLTRDTRDDKVDPSRGSHDLLRVQTSLPAIGSDFDYTRVDLRLARYRSISARQVLALRGEATSVLTGEVPFFELPRLGGNKRLRGEKGGRYRADNLLLLGAEYRLRITEKLSGVLFGEAGKVWDDSDDLNLSDFHATGGIGARYRLSNAFLLRVDVGVASTGLHKPIVDVGHAF